MLYHRRKILLALLKLMGGTLTTRRVQKYLFLLSQWQEKKAYDFVPFHYGCFSFQADQDLRTLQTYGYLSFAEEPAGTTVRMERYDNYSGLLSANDQRLLCLMKTRYGGLEQEALIRHIYQNHPYYAINSKIAKDFLSDDERRVVAENRPVSNETVLFSIGYEGVSLETYLNKLIAHDVRVLCDVRKNAYSQKFGFSKKTLQTACSGIGIQYVHLSELGIPSEKRGALLKQSDYDELFAMYERTTLVENFDAVLAIKKNLETKFRVAVTCFEKEPEKCHRTRVVKALAGLPGVDYTVKNL